MIDQAHVLKPLPKGLRNSLIKSYKEIGENYMEHRWEPSELNGGKFCEAVYTIIEGQLKGSFAAKPSKPIDMVKACRALETIPGDTARTGDRSLRVLIPRILQPLYEIRNNRGVGHAGGEVNPNFMDATAVYSMASWILAELVRIFHSVSTKEAQEIVDSLVERKHLLIWEVEGVRRVLNDRMSKADQTLMLLYSKPGWINENQLIRWIEYSSSSMFRSHILRPLHSKRLIEYDQKNSRVCLSPKGSERVEEIIYKTRP